MLQGPKPMVSARDPESIEHDRRLSHNERLASLGILAAGVAHEILNPLASILAGVEALRRRLGSAPASAPASPEAAQRILDMMERETIRARDIADKMMLLARPDRDLPGWLDLNQTVEDTMALLRFQIDLQSIQANLDLDPELRPIRARGVGVRSVCMNLVMNAVQAMPRGGALVVRTRLRDEEVLLEVEDTGPGIAPEHLSRIWDPFFTTKATGKGTGLGLSISRTIVEHHGGTIEVLNVEPHGARFTVALPGARR
jgi:two-component system, NtrC family, sensor kinase